MYTLYKGSSSGTHTRVQQVGYIELSRYNGWECCWRTAHRQNKRLISRCGKIWRGAPRVLVQIIISHSVCYRLTFSLYDALSSRVEKKKNIRRNITAWKNQTEILLTLTASRTRSRFSHVPFETYLIYTLSVSCSFYFRLYSSYIQSFDLLTPAAALYMRGQRESMYVHNHPHCLPCSLA